MKKISLTFKKPQISINGEIFDVSRSDAAIIRDLLELDRRFEGADMNDPGSVLEKNEAMLAYIDRLLPGILDGTVPAGRVFDVELPLDEAATGYELMDRREALKVMLRP